MVSKGFFATGNARSCEPVNGPIPETACLGFTGLPFVPLAGTGGPEHTPKYDFASSGQAAAVGPRPTGEPLYRAAGDGARVAGHDRAGLRPSRPDPAQDRRDSLPAG